MVAQIERIVTSGQFSLDGGTWDVDNNVWIIGDEREVVVIDAAHDALAIEEAVNGRRVKAIVCTHAHNDHINVAAELAENTGAGIWLHPDDEVLWRMVYPGRRPDNALHGGDVLTVADTALEVLHTPGHAPGAICLYAPELGALFSGDTLFQGGRARPAARTATFPRSSPLSAISCWCCRRTSPCTPVTARAPRSAPSPAPGRVDRPRPLTAAGRADARLPIRSTPRARLPIRSARC